MIVANKDNTGCIDITNETQLECVNCPPCFKESREICSIIRAKITNISQPGK